jgi:hypothetical protein
MIIIVVIIIVIVIKNVLEWQSSAAMRVEKWHVEQAWRERKYLKRRIDW